MPPRIPSKYPLRDKKGNIRPEQKEAMNKLMQAFKKSKTVKDIKGNKFINKFITSLSKAYKLYKGQALSTTPKKKSFKDRMDERRRRLEEAKNL